MNKTAVRRIRKNIREKATNDTDGIGVLRPEVSAKGRVAYVAVGAGQAKFRSPAYAIAKCIQDALNPDNSHKVNGPVRELSKEEIAALYGKGVR